MIRTSTFIFVCLVTAADALSSSVYVTRRAFWQGTAIGGSVGLTLATTTSDVANAAYTREVGGPGASAEQAAYNIQVRLRESYQSYHAVCARTWYHVAQKVYPSEVTM